jgi:hypothetical protein
LSQLEFYSILLLLQTTRCPALALSTTGPVERRDVLNVGVGEGHVPGTLAANCNETITVEALNSATICGIIK